MKQRQAKTAIRFQEKIHVQNIAHRPAYFASSAEYIALSAEHRMSAIVRNSTILLCILSMASGVFAGVLLSLLEIHIPGQTELRWTLIAGLPILLSMSFHRLNQQPANTVLATALQLVGQACTFSCSLFMGRSPFAIRRSLTTQRPH
ncbi:hypothetical protein [Simplicispira suum]|uniref:hypothetical protein n=1 Tax=Simplicispira suum TaxID=2109915 RepID=UPI0011B28620|nr:hypothetical protein [Simplicispira suum]